ncbi:nicotinate-nucleotide--dimethylbenzimidazole phosphoribosyltransferase [Streptomyces sp. NBC_01433]|uniref:nicotinate-nucleotide--dimethylbenzimidazole phosphoribosyltransferase n=1 Tax=Streptomyces sp. NBC_01433 TaxID=2903864 RepID=UPI00224FCE1C|nr:nicotinate-nucleotide--dimethylbenzimidazole phosphoribosyltransferase [Streptomyces sp. NBC_01433]MCX4678480.1 nicotinate-nucleotide--dimethylbenzimidazole phosphoribosyltransferase [Streptomyces sp. NBC_01433]
MTDTGQIPGEGLPENAGMVEQPGIPAPDAYTFLDPSEHTPEDDDLLLMPTSQGAWSDPQAAPVAPGQAPGVAASYAPAPGHAPAPSAEQAAQQAPAQDQAQAQPQNQAQAQARTAPQSGVPAQEQAAYATQAPGTVQGTHESGGRDAGGIDLNGVRIPGPTPAQTPAQVPVAAHAAAPTRRPLHRGPASAEAPSYGGTPSGGVVRSLADRGPAGAPQTQTQTQTPMPARHAGPPPTGPEYFDAPAEEAPVLPGPQLGELPPQSGAPWAAQAPQQQAVETPAPEQAVQVVQPEATGQQDQVILPEQAVQPEQAAPAETVVPEQTEAEAPAIPTEVGAEAPAEVPVEASVEVSAEAATAPSADIPVETPAEVPVEVTAEATATVEEPAEPLVPVEGPATTPDPASAPAPAPAPAPVPVAEAELPEAVVEPEPAPEPEPVVVEAAIEAPAVAPAVIEPVAAPVAPEAVEPGTAEPAAPVEPPPVAAAPAEAGPVVTQEAPAVVAAPEPVVEPETAQAPQQVPVPEDFTGPEIIETPELVEQEPTEAPPAAVRPADAVAAEEQPAEEPPAQDQPAEEFTPPAPGYDDAEREAVLRVMRERRDIRNGFRSDPIPHEVLLRVLEAAHTAPSVGHSQPWDFVVIRSAETRRSMHELAQRQRDAYASSLPKGRAKQFKELKIEAILDTPVNIVVTADPTRGGRHTLGRHTQPQMAPYSSALAVENLWLAARAEGLGVGWVSFFDEREMVRALGLPEHLEVVAYLCVGYVDEFPEEPELMQAGWSKRRPLSWVVHEETYGRRALPGEEPHDLLQETISNIRPLDAKALGEAWERQKRMTKPAGALGMLEIISAQLSGLSRMCPPPIPEPAAVAIFAGDHGVHAQGVTAWPQEVTAQMVANFLGGGAVCNAFAAQVGAEVCVVDVGVASELPATPGLLPRKVRPGTADFTTGPALSREEVLAAIEVGIETARDLVAAGNKALLTGEMGIANTTASAALICVYTGVDAAEVTGRGTGINDEMHARKVDVVRRGLDLHRPDPADPIGVLAAVGGLEHAAMAGFLLGGASLRTPVILDGVSAGAAALVARAIAPEALAACIAGHRSAEPGHVAALNKLGLRPLVDLDLRLGEGTGALLALPIVQSAARAMHEVATFDAAGVTEK